MDANELMGRLVEGEIVSLTPDQWRCVAPSFEVAERHDTGLRGEILLVTSGAGAAIVEEPSNAERVVRPLPTTAAARELIADRLATYDRMWDGCGCKIDYHR